MAAGGEPLTDGIVFADVADIAGMTKASARVLVVVADLADPALAGIIALAPNAQDLADFARPGASPRTHFHARRALTRWLVARRLGIAAEDVVIGYDAAGAPRVQAPADSCFVSVAGRDRLAAVAVADSKIGIDLEPLASVGAPVWDVLHPEEAAVLRALPADERTQPFLRLWTAKEAGLKALGEGFTREPCSVRVKAEAARQSPPSPLGGGVRGGGGIDARSPHKGEGVPRPASQPSFTLLDSASAPLAHGVWAERAGALVAVALA